MLGEQTMEALHGDFTQLDTENLRGPMGQDVADGLAPPMGLWVRENC